MDDLLREFLTETSESLATLDLELVRLEQNPNDPGLINNIFRLVHTIKGTCGFLGLPRLERLAHAGENVLGKCRDRELEVNPAAVSLILRSLDCIKAILAALEQTEAEPAGDDAELIQRLNAMAEGKAALAAAAAPAPAPAAPPPSAEIEPPAGTGDSLEALEAAWNATPSPPPPAAAAAPAEPVGQPAESAVASQSIRVSVDLLETLMTTVSELVLTRNQLLQMVRGKADSQFNVPLQRLSQVTSELQEGVMKTRMQPIGNAWAKLPRIVRDLAHELGKKIDLQMLGADTELDRQVLELIKDPLTHMVRNSADHGLEGLRDRVAAGKPETGKIVLDAYHEGGHIVIQVSDDGRGLDLKRIREKAVAKGLVGQAEVEALSEAQVAQFIFKAGFSTAAQVTSVSGRGVGMDVVRTNIEKIGGTIDLKTREGKGSTFTIKIPLTLAIVSALIVQCRGERFAIPQISVLELVRAGSDAEHRIEAINRTPVLRLRNRLLPLVYLSRILQLDETAAAASESFVVVTQVGAYSFGIVVDRVFDTEEIVVKPVSPLMRDVPIFSGNTILGDGSVIMILDPNGIAAETGDSAGHEPAIGEDADAGRRAGGDDDKTTLLVFRAGGAEPKAVPLSLVARLEELPVDSVERANGTPMVQYRGKLMPLVSTHEGAGFKDSGRQPVLVFADGDHSMGLVVDEIVDIVEEKLELQLGTDRPGSLGSAVIAGKATELVDVGHYLTRASADWFRARGEGFGAARNQRRVLLVDDSPFFRNMLAPLLSVAGYQVTALGTADEALKLKDGGADFDVIVSDIEMPGMNGFEFAAAVRKDARWSATPMVALSSHASQSDLERGREAGFSDYVAKFDRDALLSILSQTVSHKEQAA